jgi:hypothetical protein
MAYVMGNTIYGGIHKETAASELSYSYRMLQADLAGLIEPPGWDANT